MLRLPRKTQGITLFEVMLVLAIGASILVLGARVYQMLKAQSDVTQLQYNVDQVFIAAARYYQGNCKPQRDPLTGDITPGTGGLAPSTGYEPPNPYPVALGELTQGGYMNLPLPRNPIVDNRNSSSGYIIQFNLVAPPGQKKMITETTPLTTVDLGKIIMWRIQVSVKIAKPSMVNFYKSVLNADCVSQMVGTAVQPCSAAIPGGDYLVWERLPSFAAPDANPSYMSTNAGVKVFTQLYDNAPQQYSASMEAADKQNYLCGS